MRKRASLARLCVELWRLQGSFGGDAAVVGASWFGREPVIGKATSDSSDMAVVVGTRARCSVPSSAVRAGARLFQSSILASWARLPASAKFVS